jgi:hypothetical protein
VLIGSTLSIRPSQERQARSFILPPSTVSLRMTIAREARCSSPVRPSLSVVETDLNVLALCNPKSFGGILYYKSIN